MNSERYQAFHIEKLSVSKHIVWDFNHLRQVVGFFSCWKISAFIRLKWLEKHQPELYLMQKYSLHATPHTPPVWFWVCLLVPMAQLPSHLFIHSYPLSPTGTSTDSQHKSLKLQRPNSLNQDTKESFLRIYNTALRRFTRLIATHYYLFKPNPMYTGQKALCSSHPPLRTPAQHQPRFLPEGLKTGRSRVTEDAEPYPATSRHPQSYTRNLQPLPSGPGQHPQLPISSRVLAQLFPIGYSATAGAIISSLFNTSWAGGVVRNSIFLFVFQTCFWMGNLPIVFCLKKNPTNTKTKPNPNLSPMTLLPPKCPNPCFWEED